MPLGFFSFNQGYFEPDRRADPRMPFRAGVLVDTDKGAPLHGSGIDLSKTGIAFLCPEPLAVDTHVGMTFTLVTSGGKSRRVTSRAVVVSVVFSSKDKAFRTSAVFRNMPEQTQGAISRYVRHQLAHRWEG